MNKETIIAVVLVILFSVFIQEKIVEQDIRKAIVSYNDNPSFTKDSITEEDFKGAAITIFTATWCGYCKGCLLYTSPSPRDATLSRMPSSA